MDVDYLSLEYQNGTFNSIETAEALTGPYNMLKSTLAPGGVGNGPAVSLGPGPSPTLTVLDEVFGL